VHANSYSDPRALIDFEGMGRILSRRSAQFVCLAHSPPLFISHPAIDEDSKQSQPFSSKFPPFSAFFALITGLYISLYGIWKINFSDHYVRGFVSVFISIPLIFWAILRLLDWSAS
jgi:hypothetical protein